MPVNTNHWLLIEHLADKLNISTIVILPTSSAIHAIMDVWIPILACLSLRSVQASDRCSRTDASDLKWNESSCMSKQKRFVKRSSIHDKPSQNKQDNYPAVSDEKMCVYHSFRNVRIENKLDYIQSNFESGYNWGCYVFFDKQEQRRLWDQKRGLL